MARVDLCSAYSVTMRPHTVFAAISAATIWGLPLPAHLSDSDRVSVSTALPARAAHGRGVVGRSHDAARVAVRRREHLRVLAPADTWFSLAGLLEIGDLIAVGDAAVTPRFGETEALATFDERRARPARSRPRARRVARELFVDPTTTLRRSASMLAAGGWIARSRVDLSRAPFQTLM